MKVRSLLIPSHRIHRLSIRTKFPPPKEVFDQLDYHEVVGLQDKHIDLIKAGFWKLQLTPQYVGFKSIHINCMICHELTSMMESNIKFELTNACLNLLEES
ncbi:hypothetical protein K7432_015471 [Basidiobolus ranarum]|uniref:Uncharacterized protein n=1 Tax=Basidiobolus ranarum TaxID=34480 RepID=A0ABR2WG39_9FUNG